MKILFQVKLPSNEIFSLTPTEGNESSPKDKKSDKKKEK